MSTRYQLRPPTGKTGYVSSHEAARLTGVHPEVIDAYLRASITPSEPGENRNRKLGQDGIDRHHVIRKLLYNGDPVPRYISLIFSLTDELAETRREIKRLRSKLHRQKANGLSSEPNSARSQLPRLESNQYDQMAYTAANALGETLAEDHDVVSCAVH